MSNSTLVLQVTKLYLSCRPSPILQLLNVHTERLLSTYGILNVQIWPTTTQMVVYRNITFLRSKALILKTIIIVQTYISMEHSKVCVSSPPLLWQHQKGVKKTFRIKLPWLSSMFFYKICHSRHYVSSSTLGLVQFSRQVEILELSLNLTTYHFQCSSLHWDLLSMHELHYLTQELKQWSKDQCELWFHFAALLKWRGVKLNGEIPSHKQISPISKTLMMEQRWLLNEQITATLDQNFRKTIWSSSKNFYSSKQCNTLLQGQISENIN